MCTGQRYGLRVHGPWAPKDGLRCNASKLLLDPYARAIDGTITLSEGVFGHHFDDPGGYNGTDSAPNMPRCVITAGDFDCAEDEAPRTPLDETVIYETHVKGLTQRHPEVPERLRGTFAGIAHPAITGYLVDLGITAVELLPVLQFVRDSHLQERGLPNYWGYNSIGFLAPHGEYSSTGSDGGQVDEFKSMVKALHSVGIEVILDVVYNHEAERLAGPGRPFPGYRPGGAADHQRYWSCHDRPLLPASQRPPRAGRLHPAARLESLGRCPHDWRPR